MRRLGQHFLVNKSAIKKIIAALEIERGDTIVEIGPGHGELTRPLAEQIRNSKSEIRIIAIEKDPRLAEDLRCKIQDLGIKNIQIIEGDALKILKSYVINLKSYKVVGNIPYYITGYLLRIIGELQNKPSLIVLTIQKEVAERICAKTRTYADRTQTNAENNRMNLLAASVQFWAEPKIIMRLKPKDFSPPPKVDSAIITLMPIYTDKKLTNADKYYKLIKIIFKQPRKTLLNNIIKGLKADKKSTLLLLKKMGYNENSRSQDLSIKDLINLSEILW